MGQRLKTARSRTASSQRWLERQLNDPYVAAAKTGGWRSRAAFKLIEIDDKHRFLKPGGVVVDLGAAPGGWSQVAAQRVKAVEAATATAEAPTTPEAAPPPHAKPDTSGGQVVAIDYLEFDPIPGVTIVQLDFMDATAPDRLRRLLRQGRADVVLSDMAAPTTGHKSTDHLRIMGLAEAALAFALEVLNPGGAFLCKVFQGGSERALLAELKQRFRTVRHIKPPASRADSAELYVLATGFRG
ncbi:MAG: RlmE family RNA methyltransferase [Hyphomicrobiaceae bacterium]